MTRVQKRLTLVAALAALLLAILDQTIVATAATPIARDLAPGGGGGQVPWLIAAYALAGTVVQPLYGKLSDRFGPRAVFLAAVGCFIAGSLLCAAASSLGQLIAFRAIQGLGGGGLMSVAMIVVGHIALESGEDRQGGNLFGAMLLGVALVLGPTVGGQIVEHFSWRWIFLINVPLGGLAWVVAWRTMRLAPQGGREGLDLLGAALLAAVAAALLLVCQWGGRRFGWSSPQILSIAAAGLACALAWLRHQRRAPEPLFPGRVLARHTVRVIALLQLLTGMAIAGATVYVTFELQILHHASPAATGVRLLPEAGGLVLGALIGRLALKRRGALGIVIGGGAAVSAAAFAVLAVAGAHASYPALAAILVAFGAGTGAGLGTEVVLLQSSVPRRDLGIATAGVRFIETLGTAVAGAGFAAVFAARTGHGHASAGAVSSALGTVFFAAAALMGLAALAAIRLPARPSERPGEAVKPTLTEPLCQG